MCLFVRGCTLHGQSFHDGLADFSTFTTPKSEVETQSPSSRWYSSSPNPLWRTWLASQGSKTLVLRLRCPLSYTNIIHVRWLFLPGWLFFKTRLHHLIRQSLTRSSRSTNLVDWHKKCGSPFFDQIITASSATMCNFVYSVITAKWCVLPAARREHSTGS